MIDLDDINAYSEYDLENMIGISLTSLSYTARHGARQ